MSFSISTGNIWLPGATDLTSTDGNGKLFDDDKLPKPDLETSRNEIKRPGDSPNIAHSENAGGSRGLSDVDDNLAFSNFRFGEYLTRKYSDDGGIGRKVFSPDEGSKLKLIG